MKVRILQAKASNGARLLVGALREEGLNALRTKVSGSTYRGYSSHLIVNWGRNEYPSQWSGASVLNKPEAVAKATDKIKCFQTLTDAGLSHHIPKWTTDILIAEEWIEEDCEVVYCRALTRGSQGRGIVVARESDELVDAPLYTARVDYEKEVRIHVFGGQVIDFSQKKRMSRETREERGIELEPDEDVRSHSNGWVFARSGLSLDESVKETAQRAVEELGLDFGAVDAIITPSGNTRILEINTAPGLEGTTLESYKQAILGLI